MELRLSLLITVFTVASGVFDSLAFTYSASVWQGGRLIWSELAKSASCFFMGITMYWGAVRYLSQAGIDTPELQTLLWFGITIAGVAVLSGRFLHWQRLDQIIAASVLVGLGWLLCRNAA